jgi:PAS domain S-box-containing protein
MSFDPAEFLTVVGDAVLAVDREGAVVCWNASAERMFGFSAAEALGASLDLIIPERHRDRHWRGFRRVMETGQTRLGAELLRVTARRKNGTELRLALTVGVVRSPSGSIRSIGAVLRELVDPPK